LDKVNKKVNDMERMIRGLMMRTMSEQFTQLAMSNREKGTFPSEPEANLRGGSSSSFDPNDVRNVNAVISLRSGKKVDTHVGEQQANELPSPAPSSLSLLCVDVNPTTVDALPSKEVDNSKGDEPIDDSMPPTGIPTSSPCDSATPPSFSNRLKGKKSQTHVDKIREIFSQVKINIPLLDVIQQMPLYACFLKDLCTTKRATNVPKRAFLTSNVSSIISNQIPLKCKDPGCPTISIVVTIHRALLDLGASVNLLPFIVYKRLGPGELKSTKMVL